ncbi:hypothetical protein Calab_3119 [Caldithrix abyssi DSM 13497]|uniref:Uncharacterized protein n=1 Tax=Caldithrix abyssi DSM 13497 TaxID=880073 RepID=H1XTV8_CALAY|nr:hypothetical protein Cabys_1997 [Caldithrix abyssi DSM 13497]EHO42725.1 hypothetical protein Calab_3119 [Caldithrix abyssi DSM 13497]
MKEGRGLALRFVFKALPLFIILSGLFGLSCTDLERDNLLDPKNPDSYSQTVPLVEAFVNLAHPSPYNRWAVQSLNALTADFPLKMIVVHYHRDLLLDSALYDDPFNDDQQQTYFLQLQDKYVQAASDLPRVLPDVYLNGAQARFSGAYDENSLKMRMERAVSELIAQKNDYILEPIIERSAGVVQVRCLIARLGKRQAENLRLRILFLKKNAFENLELNSVVKMSWPGILIDKIKAGEYVEILGGQIAEQRADGVAFALVTEDELQVLQSKYVEF